MIKGRRIDWEADVIQRAIIMTGMGWSTAAVAGKTHLTPGQLAYRMKQLGLSDARSAYRDGRSLIARRALRAAEDIARQVADQHIRRLIEDKLGHAHEDPTPGTARPKIK